MTAPDETGKTVFFGDVVKVLGGTKGNDLSDGTAHILESTDTSGPGIRQVISGYARPVMYDELEGDGVDNKKIEDGVLKLMRTAYASAAGTIIKGGEDRTPKRYFIRCSVMCFSVRSVLEKATDKSRCLNLRMVPMSIDKQSETWARQEEGRGRRW